MKLLVGNSAIKISNLCLRFFEYKFFTFVTLNPSGRTGLIFKKLSKQKHGKDLFSFCFQKKSPKKISSNVYSFKFDGIPRST